MVTSADMVKRIPASGVLTDKTPDLFTRNETTHKFRGFATFGVDDGVSVILEVADTPEKKSRGLMGRNRMPICCGMLFTDLSGGSFWMKGCKIPLDIVFIGQDDKISKMYTMPVDNGVMRYSYGSEKTAIELACGFCKKYDIKVGTRCHWRTW